MQTEEIKQKPNWLERHNRALACAKNLKTAYKELLASLLDIEEEQVYFKLKTASLYLYCVDVLHLPSHTAYDFIDVIRTSKKVPELAQAIIEGKTTVSKARRVCSVITPQNKTQWIDLLCESPFKEIQKKVAEANPRSIVPESLKYVSSDVLELKLAVSESWAEALKDVKDLMSQKEKRAVSTEEALFTLMTEYKKKNDPVLKAERARDRADKESTTANPALNKEAIGSTEDNTEKTSSLGSAPISRYRPMSVEHEVDLRDQNQCTYVGPSGRRCESRRWLEKHHIVEFSKGGPHTAENLETLCGAHHRMKHQIAQDLSQARSR